MGRFEEDKTADNKSALFHLKTAADCGLSIAEFTLGLIIILLIIIILDNYTHDCILYFKFITFSNVTIPVNLPFAFI